MKSKKITTFFILTAMLAGVVSCGSGNGDVVTTSGGEATDTTTAGETEIHDDLPELNYNGDEFTILVEDYGGYCGADFWVEESDGDIVNDSIYNKNRIVSERLNLDIKWNLFTHFWDDQKEFLTTLRSGVLAGDGAYDIVAGLGYFMPSFVTDGVLSDMSELPYIDLTKPWWSEKFMEASSLDGKYYFVTGDASLGLIKNMFCVYENLDLAEKLGAENLYDVVREGKWTLDKMREVSSLYYADLDGDTKAGQADQFGLLLNSGNHITGFIEPFDVNIVDLSGDDPKLVYGNAHNTDVVSKLIDMMFKTEGIYYDTKGESETAFQSIFRNCNVLLATGWFMHTEAFRDIDFGYGVLPYPKWDETQENYNTTVLTTYSVMSVPADCTDKDRAAAVCEALAYESWKSVTPAYFETALKVKYVADNDSAQMFDIIRDGVSFDFGYIYTMPMDGISDRFKETVYNKKNWTTEYAKFESASEKKLGSLVEAIRDVTQ
ncbi:MAG: hypothetical protein PUG87_03230 [Eubacteriales bacterium]|nr:hypothetical protein [Eubacteriales bacterium]